ncbi:hypothetical protein [Streptobacillus notomytis]|uniref:hypothetical protein n=1 Tax=Streptobacillus notomytis TaxID=1712031 RepID=UPI000936C90D|nr:hypothetical protein [Streptobacillus notomytis]
MKKIYLLWLMLSYIIFANNKIFDFKNHKPFSGEIKTNLTVSNETTKDRRNNIDKSLVGHDLGIKAEIYEFLTLDTKFAYEYNGISKKVYLDYKNTELNMKLDFKRYGDLNIGYKFEGKYGPELEVKYANKKEYKDLILGGYISYNHVFIGQNNINGGSIGFHVSKYINNNIKLRGKINSSVLVQNFIVNRNYDIEFATNENAILNDMQNLIIYIFENDKTIIFSDIEIGGEIDYTVNSKLNIISYNELGIKVQKINIKGYDSGYDPVTSLRFKTDNQFNIKATDKLMLIPRFSLDIDKLSVNLDTEIKIDYNIIKDILINTSLGFENNFKYYPPFDESVGTENIMQYYSTKPYVKIGLLYKW